MPRGRASKDTEQSHPGQAGKPPGKPTDMPSKLGAWFGANDSSTANMQGWDIKADDLAEALLFALSEGMAVWFSTTRDGGAICITLVEGEDKIRRYAGDSIEFDDEMAVILRNKPKAPSLKVVQG